MSLTFRLLFEDFATAMLKLRDQGRHAGIREIARLLLSLSGIDPGFGEGDLRQTRGLHTGAPQADRHARAQPLGPDGASVRGNPEFTDS